MTNARLLHFKIHREPQEYSWKLLRGEHGCVGERGGAVAGDGQKAASAFFQCLLHVWGLDYAFF